MTDPTSIPTEKTSGMIAASNAFRPAGVEDLGSSICLMTGSSSSTFCQMEESKGRLKDGQDLADHGTGGRVAGPETMADARPADLDSSFPFTTHSTLARCAATSQTSNLPFVLSPAEASSPRPPPIPQPDIVSFFDPAATGGGGPLERITTEQRHRSETAARNSQRWKRNIRPCVEDILSRLGLSSSPSRQSNDRYTESTASDDHCQHSQLVPYDQDRRRTTSPHDASPPQRLPLSSSSQTLTATPSQEKHREDPVGTSGISDRAEKEKDVEQQRIVTEEAHVYPDGGYGWVVVACCLAFAAVTMGWGMNAGVWQEYYVENVFPGTNTALISLIGACQPFTMNLTAFFAGRMGDRFGFKLVLYIASVVSWLGIFSASFCAQVWQLILCQGIITGFGMGLAMPLFMSLPSQWFWKRRGMASGIAMGGAGIGGGVSVIIVRQLLSAVGYKRALLIMSFIELGVMLIATTLIRTRPTSPEARGGGRGPWFDPNVVKSSKFWSLALSLLVAIIGYVIPFIYLSQWVSIYLPDTSAIMLAVPLTILGFSVCLGRALVGIAADLVGPINTYILVFTLSGAAQIALWLTARSFPAICIFAVVYGLIAPGYISLLPQIVVQLFGPTNLATNVGLICLFNGPGNLLGGPVGGTLLDATGMMSMTPMIGVAAGLLFGGALTASWARLKISTKLWIKI